MVFDTIKGVFCVPIIPNKPESIHFFDYEFKLLIKDPAFLNVRHPFYSFHFGKVSIRSLISCQASQTIYIGHKYLCSLKQTESKKCDIGIESESKNKTTPKDLIANFCHEENSLNHQTCIQKYQNTSYFIIIQPYSVNFNTSIADINVFDFDRIQKKNYDDAVRLNQSEFIYNGKLYPVDNLIELGYEDENIIALNEIEFKSDQKLENGLIFKLIEHKSEVFFSSFLDKPSKKKIFKLRKLEFEELFSFSSF